MAIETNHKDLFSWISDRNASLVGLGIGIFGILLSIFFYYASLSAPKLTFTVDTNRTAIVRSGIASSIQVLVNNQPHTGDLTATRVLVWNAGTSEIRPIDILEPIKFKLSHNSKILEVRVSKVRRKSSKFTVIRDVKKEGQFEFNFDIIEPGNAAELTVIHEGLQNVGINAEGLIVGQGTIEVSEDKFLVVQSVVEQYFGSQSESSFVTQAIFGYMFVLGALAGLAGLVTAGHEITQKIFVQKTRLTRSLKISAIFFASFTLIIGYLAKLFISQSIPPSF